MSHHSWLYCILFGTGVTAGSILGFVGYIWLMASLYEFIERRSGENWAMSIVLGGNVFTACSVLVTLACKGVIH